MNHIKQHFLTQGWCVFDLLDPRPVYQTRAFLQAELSRRFGKQCTLEQYHLECDDDRAHTNAQLELTEAYREQRFGPEIISHQLPFFRELIGPDLFVQASPYLRIARPQKVQDNIGYHRDTFYGGSPYEISVFVPFVDLTEEGALSVLPGSHIHPENHYPTTQVENPDSAVRKGTAKHGLGFLYAPKMMEPSVAEQMKPIPLRLGQAHLFSLSTVHGSCVNEGTISRWSSDIRVMNALAPVDLSARPEYYKPLTYSVVTEAAKQYYCANGQKTRDNVELELCHTTS